MAIHLGPSSIRAKRAMSGMQCCGAFVLALISIVSVNSCSVEPASGALTAVVMKKQVSEIISEARLAASSLIGEGANQANSLLINAGNELNVQADNLSRLLADRLQLTVEKVGANYQPAVASLVQLVQDRKQLTDTAYRFKDSAVIDVQTLIATWPALGNTFLVKKLDGTSLVFNPEADYKISITGVGLGIPSARISSSTSLWLEGKPSGITPEATNDQTVSFRIPNKRIRDSFLPQDLKLIHAEYRIAQDVHPWYGIGTKHASYRVPFIISLVPHQACRVTVVRHFDHYEWQKTPRTESRDQGSGDHNCPHCDNPTHVPYQTPPIQVANTGKTVPLPHDLQIRNPVCQCIAGACPWSSVMSVVLQNNSTQAICNFSVWGSPVVYRLTADIYEYLPTNQVETKEDNYVAEFDKPLEFKVPKAPGLSAVVYYTMFTKEKDFLLPGTNHADFQLEEKTVTDDYDAYVYRIKRPE